MFAFTSLKMGATHPKPDYITWKELKAYDRIGPTHDLKRTPIIQRAYDEYTALLKIQGKSPAKNILHLLFAPSCERRIMIVENAFPYYLEPGIIHLVAWINPLYITKEPDVRKFIFAKLVLRFGRPSSQHITYIMFKNNPSHGSIPDVEHYHIFVDSREVASALIDKKAT